jgi:hypothetical protein
MQIALKRYPGVQSITNYEWDEVFSEMVMVMMMVLMEMLIENPPYAREEW